ncbi:hypothetical protein BDW68DRAFT_161988 [Aspergillus falconensis]
MTPTQRLFIGRELTELRYPRGSIPSAAYPLLSRIRTLAPAHTNRTKSTALNPRGYISTFLAMNRTGRVHSCTRTTQEASALAIKANMILSCRATYWTGRPAISLPHAPWRLLSFCGVRPVSRPSIQFMKNSGRKRKEKRKRKCHGMTRDRTGDF